MAKQPAKFLALLRGINVGGKNVIAKDDLRKCFENLGLTNVRTYIQSGNVLFRSEKSGAKELTAAVEKGLSNRFKYDAQAVVIPHSGYKRMLAAAPTNWGKDESQKHNAMFLLAGVTPKKIIASLDPPKPDIETVATSKGVIFWSVSKKFQTRTTMMKLAKTPAYKQMTVRNHNTSKKLLALFDEI